MRFLRTNTATRISIGPFLDKTDGVTPETALTVTNCKLTMTVDDGGVPTLVLDTNPTASGGSNDMVHITGDDAGMYDLELTAANVNFLGRAKVIITDAANHCPVWEDFMILPAMIYDSMILGTDRLDANVTHIADQSQTARDIGVSVLLSSGTGAGQLDFTSGVIKANLAQILGTALTETAGQIAAAFKKFFDKASPTGTVNSLPDAVAGAASGLSIVGSNMGSVTSVTGNVGGSVASVTADVGITQTGADKVWGSATRTLTAFSTSLAVSVWDVLTANISTASSIGLKLKNWVLGSDNKALLSSDAHTGATIPTVTTVTNGVTVTTNNDKTGYTASTVSDKTGYSLSSAGVQAIWDALTSALTTAGSIGKWILDKLDVVVGSRLASASYTAPLDAAGVRSAVGLASANLDTQLTGISDKTTNLPASPAATGDIPSAGAIADAVWDESQGAHTSSGSTGASIFNLVSGSLVITGYKAGNSTFIFKGGAFSASVQGETVVTPSSFDVLYDDQYQNMLLAIIDLANSGMAFTAVVVSSNASANTLTLSKPVPNVGAIDDLPFVLLPSGLGDASRALILYEEG